MRLPFRIESRVPLAIAGFFAAPVFFASLMAASLAIDKPRLVGTKEFPSASGTEAKVWLAALVPALLLVLLGALAMPIRRYGVFVVLAGALALCLLIPIRVDSWMTRHAHRFPQGMDYLKDSDPSNTSSRGEWEQTAKDTILSMTHWTLILVGVGAAFAVLVFVRRSRDEPAVSTTPLEGVHAPDVTPPAL